MVLIKCSECGADISEKASASLNVMDEYTRKSDNATAD